MYHGDNARFWMNGILSKCFSSTQRLRQQIVIFPQLFHVCMDKCICVAKERAGNESAYENKMKTEQNKTKIKILVFHKSDRPIITTFNLSGKMELISRSTDHLPTSPCPPFCQPGILLEPSLLTGFDPFKAFFLDKTVGCGSFLGGERGWSQAVLLLWDGLPLAFWKLVKPKLIQGLIVAQWEFCVLALI